LDELITQDGEDSKDVIYTVNRDLPLCTDCRSVSMGTLSVHVSAKNKHTLSAHVGFEVAELTKPCAMDLVLLSAKA
jgi:hypothetical protein